jgi:hypothetical protein
MATGQEAELMRPGSLAILIGSNRIRSLVRDGGQCGQLVDLISPLNLAFSGLAKDQCAHVSLAPFLKALRSDVEE